MQIVRATRAISAGAEIFFAYAVPVPGDEYEKTQEKLRNWGVLNARALFVWNVRIRRRLFWIGGAIFWERLMLRLMGVDWMLMWRTWSGFWIRLEIRIRYLRLRYPGLRSAILISSLRGSRVREISRIKSSTRHGTSCSPSASQLKGRTPPFSLSSLHHFPFEIEQWGFMDDCLVQTWVYLGSAYERVAEGACLRDGGAVCVWGCCWGGGR